MMNQIMKEQVLNLRSVTLADLEQDLDRLWPLLREDPLLLRQLSELDVDPNQLPLSWRDAIAVEPRGMGIDPITTAVIVKFVVPVATVVVIDVWRHIILPRIRKDHGSDQVKPEPAE
jgi:hypothetical protein